MSIKNPAWLIILIAALAVLGHFSYIPWNFVVGTFVLCVFSLGMWVEFDEIGTSESLKRVVTAKIENVERSISCALQKIDSEEIIKERLSQKRKQVIEWLNNF